MTDIDRLIGRSDDDRARFNAAHITTIEGLWADVGSDPDHGLERFPAVGDVQGIDQNRMMMLLGAQAVREADEDDGSWLNAAGARQLTVRDWVWWKWLRHTWLYRWMEWGAVIAIVALIIVGIQIRHSLTPTSARQVVVVAATGLPPYHTIGKRDIATKNVPRETGALTTEADALGHVTLRYLPHGAVVHHSQVSAMSLPERDQEALKADRVLTVALDPAGATTAVAAGDDITLLLSPRDARAAPAARQVGNVLVLAVKGHGSSTFLVVAVHTADLAAFRRLLGASTVVPVTASR